MYNKFFGFKEKPFKLVPNPDYLFLSKCHEEALAHLNYAISQGDGFVLITGEVGTGKTTLCRAFLETLEDNTKAAYIFNPKLGPRQLLMTINDEFDISSRGNTTKELIDALNSFLMHNKAEGNKVIVLIDEAQNLSQNVLEQLRLLSNLETNRDKLLQIVLVGQPELSEMLESHELRQLGQRITLSYYLRPLSFGETCEYIQYRINIAAQKAGLKFDRSAYRQIYKYSKGIPRLTNIVCDRALLTAFVLNQHKITGNILKATIRELAGHDARRSFWLADGSKALLLIFFTSLVLVGAIYYRPLKNGVNAFFQPQVEPEKAAVTAIEPETKSQDELATLENTSEGLKPATTTDVLNQIAIMDAADHQNASGAKKPKNAGDQLPNKVALDLKSHLQEMDVKSSRMSALKCAMQLWNAEAENQPYLDSIEDDQSYFRISSKPNGISIHRIEADMGLLRNLNLPAILEFYPPGGPAPGYLTLTKIDGDRIELGGATDDRVIVTDQNEIESYWTGVAYIPWKNFLSIWGTIPSHTYKDSIITLKLLLHELGFANFEINAEYDDPTQIAVEKIQAKYGVPVDGFVGPLTKIILYRERQSFDMPRLTKDDSRFVDRKK